jgi:hypothetical protein
MDDIFLFQLIVWLAMGAACAAIANAKGRNAVGWFFIGVFLSLIGLIIILVLPNVREQDRLKNLQDAHNQRLQEQLRQERLKHQAFQSHASARLDNHDTELGINTRQLTSPLIGQSSSAGMLPPGAPMQHPADSQWYYALDGNSIGPFSVSRMADLIGSGVVQNNTMVYESGRSDWVMAGACEALRPYFSYYTT